MKKGSIVALFLVACLAFNSMQARAWTGYTSYEDSPFGYAGSFKSSPTRCIIYSGSGNLTLYRSHVTTQFALGTENMPSWFERYTERGGYGFTDSVHDPSNPDSYVIANSNWTQLEIDPSNGYYRPLSWHPSSMSNQVVETSGIAVLRLRFMFDIYGTDTGTYFYPAIFSFRYIINQ